MQMQVFDCSGFPKLSVLDVHIVLEVHIYAPHRAAKKEITDWQRERISPYQLAPLTKGGIPLCLSYGAILFCIRREYSTYGYKNSPTAKATGRASRAFAPY